MAVVVFGGNGFVGTNVLKALCARQIPAVSISRSGGRPQHLASEPWAAGVAWETGDAAVAATYYERLVGARAIVVSVGSPPVPFVDYEWQKRVNGASNAAPISAARDAGVARVVIINAMMPAWAPAGYVDGKRMAEAAAAEFAAAAALDGDGADGGTGSRGAVVLKPGAVYGTRYTKGGTPIPLAPVLAPVSWALTAMPGVVSGLTSALPSVLEGALVPPVNVERLAEAAAEGATSDKYTGKVTVLDSFALNS